MEPSELSPGLSLNDRNNVLWILAEPEKRPNAKAKLPGPPARTLTLGKPPWRPRSASASRRVMTASWLFPRASLNGVPPQRSTGPRLTPLAMGVQVLPAALSFTVCSTA